MEKKLKVHKPTEDILAQAYNTVKSRHPTRVMISHEEVMECYNCLVGHSELESTAVTNLTLEGIIAMFNLQYHDGWHSAANVNYWDPEPTLESYQLTPCLRSFLTGYFANFARNSEPCCRTATDLLLNECLIVLKGLKSADDTPSTPSPFADITIYGEVSFKHSAPATDRTKSTQVSGRVDYGIGRTMFENLKKRFWALMLVIEAKNNQDFGKAFRQLLAYLGALHQARQQGGRSDTSVYGCATNGTEYEFVMITVEGVVKRTKTFQIRIPGDLEKILAILTSILKITFNRSPNTTPRRAGDTFPGTDGNLDAMSVTYDMGIDVDAADDCENSANGDFEDASA